MKEKRIFCLYDNKAVPRYIGATALETAEDVVKSMTRHYNTAVDEIKRGKVPNRREILLKTLIKLDYWDLRFISSPLVEWAKAKEETIKVLKSKGIILANETTGAKGATGNKLSTLSIGRRQNSKNMMDSAKAYRMHVLYREKSWTQKQIAEKFGLTEKGVQKIITGTRRSEAYAKWLNNRPKTPFDPNEDMPF